MNKENKELLLKDLCARLPYGVKILIDNKYAISIGLNVQTLIGIDLSLMTIIAKHNCYKLEKIKPYLRSMSSMTEEEKHYIDDRWGADNYGDIITYSSYEGGMSTVELADIIGFQDWLNVHHFDYRGLIEKGLALEAPEDMYI